MKQLRGLDFDPRLKTKVSVGKQFPFERDWFFSEEIPHEKMQKMATFQRVQILNFFRVRRGETACKVAKLCANKYLALVPFSLHRSFALSPSQTTANKPPASQAMRWICVRNVRRPSLLYPYPKLRPLRDWSKSIGGGGPEHRGGGSWGFEPCARGGSCKFQLPLGGGSPYF